MTYRVKDLMFDTSTWDDDGSNFVGLTGIIFDGCIEGPNGFFSVEVEKFLDEELEEVYQELDEKINLRKQIEQIKKDILDIEKALRSLAYMDLYRTQKFNELEEGKMILLRDLEFLGLELALKELKEIHIEKVPKPWKVYSSKEKEYDVFDWLFDADPENGLDFQEDEFKHCNKKCSHNDHCMCPFECAQWMLYDGCSKFQEANNEIGWSVQAKIDFIG